MAVSAKRKGRARPRTRRSVSRTVWTEAERKALRREVARLREKLGRTVRPSDLPAISIPNRTLAAIKNQALRMRLYRPTRRIRRWSLREMHVLVILGRKRGLGAKGIKSRGFFSVDAEGWHSRSVDSIAQKKRREGHVNPVLSLRARIATRLTEREKKKLHAELRRNVRKRSTEEFAFRYGVAPSTIRRYRQRWGIEHSWQLAMALPAARAKRKRLSAETRERNLGLWQLRKTKLRGELQKAKASLLKRRGGKPGKIYWRRCERCQENWPATHRFFARSPKRRDGKVVAVYLRRSCRVCPRRGRS